MIEVELTDRTPLDAAERRLWQAVLLLALADATAPRTARTGFDRREARDWLDAAGPHFALVCDLAGLDPARARTHWRRLRRTTIPLRVFRAAHRKPDR